jgi:hypothetical protein
LSEFGDRKTESVGASAYVVGGLAFIPLIGVLFGIAAIAWGLATDKRGRKLLIGLGASGIGFTVVLYGSLFYFAFGQRGGMYDDLRAGMTQSSLNSLVPMVEFYKIQNGRYPESLDELQKSLPKESFISVYDPSIAAFGARPQQFYYERTDSDHYYLRAVGPDGKPFTDDDIVPQIGMSSGSKIGLLIKHKPDS